VFEKDFVDGNDFYKIAYTDEKGIVGNFGGVLGKINDTMFLNILPTKSNFTANNLYMFHLLPVHTFIRIEQIEPTLKMRMMETDKFEDAVKENPGMVKHETLKYQGRIILTASTEELQTFMKKNAKDNKLFGDVMEWERMLPENPNDPNTKNSDNLSENN
jgi:hypothetical protein